MSKLFLVSIGEYSDYRIVGIYSSREKAEEMCPALKAEPDLLYSSDMPEIEEWELDDAPVSWRESDGGGFLQVVYAVFLDVESGDAAKHFEDVRPDTRVRPLGWYKVEDWKNYHDGDKPSVLARSVVSREHAQKLAAERRQAILRNFSEK